MKFIYVWFILIISALFYFRPKKNVYYIMSYDSNLHLLKRIAAEIPDGQKLVVFYNPRVLVAAYDLKAFGIKAIPLKNSFGFALLHIPSLMTARLVFCDNYYAFMAGILPSKKMKIVQLWHADGTIKCFGFENPANAYESFLKKHRHQTFYNHIDNFVVASKAMGHVFQNSCRQSFDKMKFLGFTRSDRLFSDRWINTVRNRIYLANPELKGKRVILYAPTFRPGDSVNPPQGTIEALASDPNAMVAVKLYQEVDRNKLKLDQFNHKNVRIYDEFSITDLMTIADTFVTDYSSYAFDFSLLPQAKSMLFFMYDMKEYEKNPGIQNGFENWLPSKPITTVSDLSQAIKAHETMNFDKFNQMWNTYNDGKAYKRVIDKYVLCQENAAEDHDE
ncbi:glycosyl transferase [Fructilactobacillus lindneri]|nr:CDP-glycerol glycerophosphotransferase family protein [Fructilactobacillus lindneri]POH08678.1 glycosyl transferase [Fructilactobacillus lindneri]